MSLLTLINSQIAMKYIDLISVKSDAFLSVKKELLKLNFTQGVSELR